MVRRIREADLADLDALTALIADANSTYREWAGESWSPPDDEHERRHWREQIARPDAWAAVAVDDGGLVGCIDFMPSEAAVPGLAHLSRLFVAPGSWRSGIASELCTECVAEMRRRGFTEAELFTAVANTGARAFYESRGWTATDETRYWHGLELLRYACRP